MIPKIEAKVEIPRISARMKTPRPQARMVNSAVYKTYRLLCERCRRNPNECSCATPQRTLSKLIGVHRVDA